MAQPRRKGKSKQKKSKPHVVIETQATPVEEEKANVVETQEEQKKELSPKELKKLEKEKLKKDKQIAKEKADKKKKEERERKGKISLKQRFKETGSELKKVSWPSFGETMKKTGVVIGIVVFFAVVLVAFDFLLSFLYKLLT